MIRTERLTLRPPGMDDLDDLHRVFSDPRAMRYWSHPAHDDLDRTRRMFHRSKNFPSVVIWSLGNEAGDGVNLGATYHWLKENDASRPVQYETEGDIELVGERHSDFDSTMYKRHWDLALELTDSPLSAVMPNEVWTEVYDRLAELVERHATTLIFVNTRRLAERLARHLAERLGEAAVTAPSTLRPGARRSNRGSRCRTCRAAFRPIAPSASTAKIARSGASTMSRASSRTGRRSRRCSRIRCGGAPSSSIHPRG